MQENNIIPKTARNFKAATNCNRNYPVTKNILNRNFTVDAQGKAYLWILPMLQLLKGSCILPLLWTYIVVKS
jgi:hypothetical protein